MNKLSAVIGSAFFLLAAPGTVAGGLPYLISGWRVQSPFFGFAPIRWFGVLLVLAGLAVLLDSFFIRFALQGGGTPAPTAPPRRLVVTGFYRYMRNAMYLAVTCVILGQGIFFGDPALIGYAFLVGLAFHLFVLLYEEPALRKAFGAEYAEYCINVPRWIPRRTPWKKDQ